VLCPRSWCFYRTAFRWLKAERSRSSDGYGTILITEPIGEPQIPNFHESPIYTRVSAAENKDNLEGQANRLRDYCAAKVSSSMGGERNWFRSKRHSPKLLKLLTDPSVSVIVVEHKDRLTRFGYNYLEQLLKVQDRRIEVIILAEDGKEDLIQDFVSIVTLLCTPVCQRRSKRKTSV